MKKFLKEFLFRGLICAAGGPLVLAVIYGILGAAGAAETIPATEVSMGIVTITLLAFIAAGMTAIYQVERLPIATMILLHGGALYIAYILTCVKGDKVLDFLIPILIFTGIFLVGYALIWLIIYCIEKAKADKLNKLLKD